MDKHAVLVLEPFCADSAVVIHFSNFLTTGLTNFLKITDSGSEVFLKAEFSRDGKRCVVEDSLLTGVGHTFLPKHFFLKLSCIHSGFLLLGLFEVLKVQLGGGLNISENISKIILQSELVTAR